MAEIFSEEDAFKVADLLMKQHDALYAHQYNSYNRFVDEQIHNFLLNSNNNVFFEKITNNKVYKYSFRYSNISIKPPYIDVDNEDMFPQDARLRNFTYGGKLVANVTQIQEITDINTEQKVEKVIGDTQNEYPIAVIPIMLRSKYCNLVIKKKYINNECRYDPGGYFIVNGAEKVIMPPERMIDNRPLVFITKDSSTTIHKVQVNSKNHKTDEMQIINIRMKKDNSINILVPILNEVSVFILMRALGIESDLEIINHIVYDKNDTDMLNIVRIAIEKSKPDQNTEIVTRESALSYLINKMRTVKKYNETDKVIRMQEKKRHLMYLLENKFLPHVENNLPEKAYYVGMMINRLLQCYLGRIDPDDRDSFINKRINVPGQLMFDLFKQFYKKMLNECSKQFSKKNTDDERPIGMINMIKSNIIEQGLKNALLTGAWGKQKGVAQMLQRLSYLQTISSLRRYNSPTVDASTNKLTGPRHLHGTMVGHSCLVGDTEVMYNHDSLLIKTITDQNIVTTINRTSLKSEESEIYNKFSLNPRKVITITTVNNRELKCTVDHPIFVKKNHKYMMIEAGELKPNDLVMIKPMRKYMALDYPTKFMVNSKNIDKYKSELSKLDVVNRNFSQNELEIMARLLAANIVHGSLYMNSIGQFECSYNVANEGDLNNILTDVTKLGFPIKKYTYLRQGVLTCVLQGAYAYFMYLLGSFMGNPKKSFDSVPEWIKNGNNRITKEFLAGLGIIDKLSMSNVSVNLESVYKFIKDIQMMFSKLSIKTTIINDNNTIVLSLVDSSKLHYIDYVNVRYRTNDEIKLNIIGESLRNNNNVAKYIEQDDIFAIPIKTITESHNEDVYDFTTKSENHTFVANGFIVSNCFVETSEGHKVGLVKNLSLAGSITVIGISQIDVIKKKLIPMVKNIKDVPSSKFGQYSRVLLNGEVIGLTDKPDILYKKVKQMKYSGSIDILTSVCFDIRSDIECKDIRISCDSGRLYHPAIRVEDNELLLTKKMLDSISLDEKDVDKVISWKMLLAKYPGVIEYLDSDEVFTSMVAMTPDKLIEMKGRQLNSIKLVDKMDKTDLVNIVNRYDDTMYVKYTHCEIHPALLIGCVVANIPYLECNPGPRNVFQYSQMRQAMGLYATNYKERMDISYILYHPQRPLVSTRLAKYLNTDNIPAGENCIVAMACYGGYNQEDGNIINQGAIDRGLLRTDSLKKYVSKIQKNQSTSQDDIFQKPNRDQVIGLSHGSYDKLDEAGGYAPAETFIENGDIIIGKVSPIQPVGNSGKIFKDSSEFYKSTIPGYIDKVYPNLHDAEGYRIIKTRTRSMREPMVGDKFCCYDDSHEILTLSGWKQINNITIDDKVACLINNDILEYHNPIAIQEYDYKGDMFNINTHDASLCVTPNHRMYVKMHDNYEIVEIQNINQDFVMTDNIVNYNTTKIEVFQYQTYKYDIAMWIYIFGNMVIGRMGYNKLIELLNITDFVEKVSLVNYLENLNKERLPEWVWTFSTDQMRMLLDIIQTKPKCISENDYQQLRLHAGSCAGEIHIKSDGIYKTYHDGKVYCCTVPGPGVIYVRRNMQPIWCGNSRHANKNTNGIMIPQSSAMFAKDGMSVDICISPNSVPSRMTIGQLIETLAGTLSAAEGMDVDATPFSNFNVDSIKKKLVDLGYSDDGTSYMYNGMTGEKMKVKIFAGPTYYQRLKHISADKIHCLTLDHEVLTFDGWKKHNELSFDDKIATLKNGELVYDKVLDIMHFDNYKGKMYRIKNNDIDLCVTDNHRMWVSRQQNNIWQPYQLIEANYIINDDVKYQKGAQYNASDYIIDDAWIKLFNIVFNQGIIMETNVVSVESSDLKQDKLLHDCLERLKILHQCDSNCIIINNEIVYDMINKGDYPSWIWKLSRRQCQMLDHDHNNDRLQLHTEEQKDIFVSKDDCESYDYEGPVFCIQVPSEIFYVRRNNKAVWTGNSRARGPRTMLTRSPPEGRILPM